MSVSSDDCLPKNTETIPLSEDFNTSPVYIT